VGDAEFQKRCLGKMGEVAKGGRTVLFVSHNMAAVQNLCTRGVLLRTGRVALQGDVGRVLTAYLAEKTTQVAKGNGGRRPLGSGLTLDGIMVTPGEPTGDEPLTIEFTLSSDVPAILTDLCLILYSALDVRVGILDLRPQQPPYSISVRRKLTVRCQLEPTKLVEGDYQVGLYAVSAFGTVHVPDVCWIGISPPLQITSGTEAFISYQPEYRGVVEFRFTSSFLEDHD